MKVLHIIGNGLDISLGMETQYKAFLQNYYLTKDNPKETILKLKKNINQNLDNWSDAELEFGNYAKYCDSTIEYIECINDFKSNLREYISSQYQSVFSEQTSYYFSDFLTDLKYPEKRLAASVLQKFNSFYKPLERITEEVSVNVLTFNYTNTFEQILQEFGKTHEAYFKIVNSIKVYHVHGTLNNQMTFGVNDPSQIISEKNIMDESNFFEIVKPLFNDACLNTNNSDCENLINQADIISIYGASIGATDQKWWDYIGNQMQERSNLSIIYFPFDNSKDPFITPQYLSRWCTEYQRFLIERLNLPKNDDKISDRIFVNVNVPLFEVTQSTIN